MDPSFHYIAANLERGALIVQILAPSLNDFDLSHAIAKEIEQAIGRYPIAKLVLDLKNVELLTSVGLIVFARVLKATGEQQIRAALCNAAPIVAEVLVISRLGLKDRPQPGQLALAADVDAALAALGEGV